jgi:Helix-turn-helix domain
MIVGLVHREQVDILSVVVERLDAHGLEEESHALRELLVQLKGSPDEVSASVAAEILRVTPKTVRNWVRGGTLPGRRDQSGHFQVRLDTLAPVVRLNQLMPNVSEAIAAISAVIFNFVSAVREASGSKSSGRGPSDPGTKLVVAKCCADCPCEKAARASVLKTVHFAGSDSTAICSAMIAGGRASR